MSLVYTYTEEYESERKVLIYLVTSQVFMVNFKKGPLAFYKKIKNQ